LPAGTVIKATGMVFDQAATLTVDGVSVGSVQVASSSEVDFTLGAPTEMTGKRVVVTNPDRSQAEYFPLLPGVGPDGRFYVFPLRTGNFILVNPGSGPVVQNPNLDPIDITVVNSLFGYYEVLSKTTLSPAQVMIVNGVGSYQQNLVSSSGPMRDNGRGFSDPRPIHVLLPPFVDFAATAGSSGMLSQTVLMDIQSRVNPPSISISTQSGANWLSVSQTQTQNGARLTLTANPAGLPAGTYLGTITATVTSASIPSLTGSATAVIRLDIAGAQQLAASPPSVHLSARTGALATQSVSVDSGFSRIPFQARATTSDGGNWLSGDGYPALSTPATFPVIADASNLTPGAYQGSILVTSSSQSLAIPVTLNVVPADPPVGPPVIGSIVNAASAAITAVSPGEIITIYGTELGSSAGAGVILDARGNVGTTLSETQVLFGDTPAPLTYVSRTQINAVVPYEVADAPVAAVQVKYAPGGMSAPMGVPVVAATPGVFTVSGSGQGAAAVLNEDNSLNSPSNAAMRGSVIQIYGTGGGMTSPAGTTGSIAPSAATTVLQVHVTIGGVDAQVMYAGSAPGYVNGLMQVNALVPQTVAAGMAVPIVVTVGSTRSEDRATIAVQ
jgi:uncharacterized protein (TIGR03437 family)